MSASEYVQQQQRLALSASSDIDAMLPQLKYLLEYRKRIAISIQSGIPDVDINIQYRLLDLINDKIRLYLGV